MGRMEPVKEARAGLSQEGHGRRPRDAPAAANIQGAETLVRLVLGEDHPPPCAGGGCAVLESVRAARDLVFRVTAGLFSFFPGSQVYSDPATLVGSFLVRDKRYHAYLAVCPFGSFLGHGPEPGGNPCPLSRPPPQPSRAVPVPRAQPQPGLSARGPARAQRVVG